MRIVAYTESDRTRWNDFVRRSKNGTFLFQRDYLEYHADRFPDASLLVEDDGGRLLAVLPATRRGDLLASHAGLTYGGFVTNESMTSSLMLAVFDATRAFLGVIGVSRVVYKTIPHIYHRIPAEEDRYALFRSDAKLVRSEVLSVVAPEFRGPVQERRRRGIRKAEKAGVEVRRSTDLAAYWRLLELNLANRYGLRPTHAIAEIELLASRFPNEIALWTAKLGGEVLAGVVVYDTPRVAHAQYIGASDAGREVGALDMLVNQLISEHYSHKAWFDFGNSNEEGGRVLNEGLVAHKEGFGARSVAHDFFEMDV